DVPPFPALPDRPPWPRPAVATEPDCSPSGRIDLRYLASTHRPNRAIWRASATGCPRRAARRRVVAVVRMLPSASGDKRERAPTSVVVSLCKLQESASFHAIDRDLRVLQHSRKLESVQKAGVELRHT